MTKGEIFVNWEPVREGANGYPPDCTGYRLRVPGGWVYRPASGGNTVYIPDPNHEWGKEVPSCR
jgi:hypothetical protein